MSSGMETKDTEEEFRRAAADGNEDALMSMVSSGVNVNSQNSVNGWTALHWACKRGHKNIVSILLKSGADSRLASTKGETSAHVTSDPQILQLLGISPNEVKLSVNQDLPIVPNYLRSPIFPYGNTSGQAEHGYLAYNNSPGVAVDTQNVGEVILKVRVGNAVEKDFIEIDLPKDSLTYNGLVDLMCSELNVSKGIIQKVRKLPDTIVRRDKDVQRLQNYQELELVLVGAQPSTSSNFQSYKASVAPKHFEVFY